MEASRSKISLTTRTVRRARNDNRRTLIIKDGWTSYHVQVANPPDEDDPAQPKDEETPLSPGPGSAVLVRKTKDSTPRSPTNGSSGEGEDDLPPVDTLEACDKAAERLRELSNHLNHGEVPMDVLQRTVGYAVSVLETIYMDETKRLLDEDDELSEVQPDAVPPEVREWLAATFTRQMSTTRRKSEDKLRFKSVAHAIRAGIMVDRIYRRLSSSSNLQMPAQIAQLLKNSEDWSFDVFTLNSVAGGQCLRYMGHYLLNRFGLIQKFKIPTAALESFLVQIENGYERYRNPYHNNMHAADVTQTVAYLLCQAGLANWLTDIEIFATLFAAIIHDYEHTGTTNSFHVMSGSETALLYNDRSVLENYHISQSFRLLKDEEHCILNNLSKEEFREFRALVIDMVLATDMSSHFQQIKTMKSLLAHSDFSSMDKAKVLSLMLHCCDISHPAKDWNLHFRWTQRLMEEFFRQGDKENELGLPFSPLCDRNSTLVAESQIGFIDFIVSPSLEVCGDMLDRVLRHMEGHKDGTIAEDTSVPSRNSQTGSPANSPAHSRASPRLFSSPAQSPKRMPSGGSIRRPWLKCLENNKQMWQELSGKDAELREQITEASKKRFKEYSNGLDK
ncbi:dual specificity calcium/calmodulin-dependent 3',5'-cyclic nucleotide phosphodiesterase 1A isoform X3 [Parasteatoda tepidariorum]|uniref:dual specificity calcium/calmodulin-dependent 3',5'-cyclic nucleotide phosphodiesterase 1A isoform X2 n=1 Tax=Parasteatoda tepidariorum TaxID=114398 RepID=UPI001C72806D|nr:calcium/calmodulin-dependent 3',5'-cyclic nucleotide phosphodiesterase 1A isoform X2 [Parasteatoda tepidariorum]